MPFSIGTRIGPYEIAGPLGKGGMGEVYRAKDTKLDRDVAIKVLPDSLARDAERLGRFEREAKVLASLNHPNIATVYSLEEFSEGKAIAMELVDGATLRSPQPLDAALNYALQIAGALEAAHDKGVTHRDLKPANIMVTSTGLVKLLDFGLAGVARPAAVPGDDSPTMTLGMTEAGVIMGTAAYMAPEQAVGNPVDRRADIWAFGVVLWQMLVGKTLFSGDTTGHILANVINSSIDFGELPESTPAPIRELLKRCLDRDVKMRLQAISEARISIQKYLANPHSQAGVRQAEARIAGSKLGWLVASLMALVAGVALLGWLRPRPEARPVTRFSTSQYAAELSIPTLSRDGSHLAYRSGKQIFVRAMDQFEAKAIPGVEAAIGPFSVCFSPDGQWIAYIGVGGELKKVPVTGGPALTLSDGLQLTYPWAWGEDNNIYIGGRNSGIMRVPASGGTPEAIVAPDSTKNELSFETPQLLPGGKQLLVSIAATRALDGIQVAVWNLETHEKKILLKGAGMARYAPTGPGKRTGHIVYFSNGSLVAVPFDLNQLQMGTPTAIVEGALAVGPLGVFDFSDSGALAYVTGETLGRAETMVWVDRQGAEQPIPVSPLDINGLSLSPDGGRVAASIREAKAFSYDLWVYELAGGRPTRLTSEGGNASPVWAPDAARLIYWFTPIGGGGRSGELRSTPVNSNAPVALGAPDNQREGRADSSKQCAVLPAKELRFWTGRRDGLGACLFAMLKNLVQNEATCATDESANQHSVLLTRHATDGRSHTGACSDCRSGSLNGMSRHAIRANGVDIRSETLIQVQVPN